MRLLDVVINDYGNTAVGQLETADASSNGACKRAFLVPEQFTFEQARGDGGAVFSHQGLFAA
jgi:hypothetical protein